MAQPQVGDPFQVEGRSEVCMVDLVEWGASRSSEPVVRHEYYVVRSREGDRYVLIPLPAPQHGLRWRGVPLRAQPAPPADEGD